MEFPMQRLILVLLLLALSTGLASAKPPRPGTERYYQELWCLGQASPIAEIGKVEAVQTDKTRVDCLTTDYAIEFDFASKLNDAIGQCLGYAIRTGKRPGIVLILKAPKDLKYWRRLQEIILRYNLPIQTWKMKAYE